VPVEVEFRRVDWQYKSPFRISYNTKTHDHTLIVELRDGATCARGEALGVPYKGESIEAMLEQVASVASDLRNGMSRAELQQKLPAGGARNALDCALWDWEAKRSGRRVWELAGLPAVQPIDTDFTLGLDEPTAMATAAANASEYPLIKIKLGGDCDLERIRAIRCARQDVTLIVDANQSWSERELYELTPQLAALGVKLIEQPLPVGEDAALMDFDSPVPLCADESCQTTQSLLSLAGKYDFINIKLDKTGGLTGAMHLARAARQAGFKLMVGCFGGTSLSMAPAFVVAQLCEYVDLDGPLLLTSDVAHGIRYQGNRMFPPDARLWG
jgi:L-Ala-D/L-Glu epimerase